VWARKLAELESVVILQCPMVNSPRAAKLAFKLVEVAVVGRALSVRDKLVCVTNSRKLSRRCSTTCTGKGCRVRPRERRTTASCRQVGFRRGVHTDIVSAPRLLVSGTSRLRLLGAPSLDV